MLFRKKGISFLLAAAILGMTACTPAATDTTTAQPDTTTPQSDTTTAQTDPSTTTADTTAATQPAETAPATQAREISPMTPGEYVIDAKGLNPMKVKVVLSEKAIDEVEILEHTETPTVAEAALRDLPAMITGQQSIKVDTVSGATYTSQGILDAVKQALEQAGANLAEFEVAPVAVETAEDARPLMGTKELPSTWDETYDIIVIGGGFAGLSASYTAASKGASVALIEKMPMLGGNSQINGGVYAAYTSKLADEFYAKLNLTPDTAEKHIEDTIAGGDFMGRPELVKNLVYGSPEFLNLMLDNGLKVRESITRPGGHYGYRTYTTENGVGADIVRVQKELLAKTDCKVHLETTMTQIYRETAGEQRVVGIRVRDRDGKTLNLKAEKGVILSTGGFSGNIEMRQRYVPALTADLPTTNHVGATGEGITMAQEIGANTIQMAYIQLYPFANPDNGVLDATAVIPFSGPSSGIVYVDANGKRYVNEGERRDVCSRAAQNSGGFPTFSIFGQEIVDKGGFIAPAQLEGGMAQERIFRADTLEDLVKQINDHQYQGKSVAMTAETLQQTIDTHNGYVEQGEDPDFGKVIDKGVMLKIEEGPYYAVPQWPSVHHTMGGLEINARTEVIDIWNHVIPGLYAAGEVSGGVHGTNRLGSNAIPDAAVHGWIAGEVAATGNVPAFVPKE